MPFPAERPRRLRRTPALRRLCRETRLSVSSLVLPLFVREDIAAPVAIPSLPGHRQETVDSTGAAVEQALAAGVGAVLLFGVPTRKDAVGSEAWNSDGIVQSALRSLRGRFGDDCVLIADCCLDEYTDHGHCGVLREDGSVDNDATLPRRYSGDSNYRSATGVNSVTVTAAETPTFTVTGTPASLSFSSGATTGNTSTITVTSVGGFTGGVTLTAALTSRPTGAQDPPTLSFVSTSLVNITPGNPGTATLTISTTASMSSTLAHPVRPGARWYIASGTGLVTFALLIGVGIDIPGRRRSRRRRISPLVLLVTLIGGLLASGSGGKSGGSNSGTTPGTCPVQRA